jgi:hypothetical protein
MLGPWGREDHGEAMIWQRLEQAIGDPDARVIVRTASAIAELPGPLPLRAGEWITLGTEGQPHLHVRAADAAALHLQAPDDGNVALELVDAGGARILRVAFVRTNPQKPECDHARRDALIARFTVAGGGLGA